MSETNYRPNGNLQGDTKAMPNRGYKTGVTDTYGADLSGDATNAGGSIKSHTKSHPMDKCSPPDPQTCR